MNNNDLYIGALSGTSLDAIDIGLFSFTKSNTTFYHALNYPIPSVIKEACLQLMGSTVCDIEQLGILDNKLGLLFAEAIIAFLEKYQISPTTITAIGCHGQTIHHKPNIDYPFTMQIGNPNIIAALTGITTIADFRRKDLAVGGQGAPLAPNFHAAMFSSTQANRVIVNIGGISNISILHRDFDKPVLGFDTGPGNCLLDAWVQKNFNMPYDHNGDIAKKGKLIPALLNSMLADPYFQIAPPKSTGREYFNLAWLNKYLQNSQASFTTEEVQATLVQLTSKTISNVILSLLSTSTMEIYICGGGAYNQALLAALEQDLQQKVKLTTELGIAPDWVEAGLFAWLAQLRLLEQPGNLPSVTGASKAVVLGGVYV